MDFNIYTDYGRSTCRLGVYRGKNCLIFEKHPGPRITKRLTEGGYLVRVLLENRISPELALIELGDALELSEKDTEHKSGAVESLDDGLIKDKVYKTLLYHCKMASGLRVFKMFYKFKTTKPDVYNVVKTANSEIKRKFYRGEFITFDEAFDILKANAKRFNVSLNA